MKLSKIFEEKPKSWGFRGDPYFWDYLKGLAENINVMYPDALEKWIKEEYFALSGKVLTDKYMDFGLFWHNRGSENGVGPVVTRHGGFCTFG